MYESEAKNMHSQIVKYSPRKKKNSILKSLFSKKNKKKKNESIVISMPEASENKASVHWDPEGGYQIDGSLEDLPQEHRDFVLQQGYVPNKK